MLRLYECYGRISCGKGYGFVCREDWLDMDGYR